MHPIRWWRVRRAYALLRFTFGMTFNGANIGVAHIAIMDMELRGHAPPAELISALAVIQTKGAQRPAW